MMQSANVHPAIPSWRSSKSLLAAVILVILAGAGFVFYRARITAQAQSLPPALPALSQPMLAEQYGLGVNLIAVTAAGGLVDLRLKIIDGQKAKALLQDQANFPALRTGNGLVLRASQDLASQPIKFENGSNLFVLYPNAQNAVKPGDPVSVIFGDHQVEAIPTK